MRRYTLSAKLRKATIVEKNIIVILEFSISENSRGTSEWEPTCQQAWSYRCGSLGPKTYISSYLPNNQSITKRRRLGVLGWMSRVA